MTTPRLGYFTRLLDAGTPLERYRHAIAQFVRAEELGFDTAWVAQHHFNGDEGGLPSPFVLLAQAAAQTSRIVLATGDANANYLPGFLINTVYGLAFLISLLVGRPLVGVAVGVLLGDRDWREEPVKRRLFARLTMLWVALFAIRLAVELPLFLAGDQIVALGIARIVLGLPLYAIVLVLTVLGVQAVHRDRPSAPDER